ncbi:NAD(P)H-hydrate dehydratase [Mycoplasmatota bacterium WC30]
MIVCNVKEMKEFELHTLTSLGISEIELMSRAGANLVKDFVKRVKPNFKNNITIFAGIGNNGGDALVMAIELKKLGYKPDVFVVGDTPKATDAFMYYYDLAGKINIISNASELEFYQEDIINSDIIIDGILGIGITRKIAGYRNDLIKYINESDTVVYSIDMPSGLNPENGIVLGNAIEATFTGIVGFYKLGNLLHDALDYHGKSKVLDIGIIQKYPINRSFIDITEYDLNLSSRKNNSNKYTFGLGIFVGGRKSMMGSIQMSAMAGLKTGMGLSVVVSDLKGNDFTQFYPEIIVQDNVGEEVMPLLKKAACVVFGPGIRVDNGDYRAILEYLLDSNIPLLIDATGFEYLDVTKKYRNKNIVLTPHVGELAKLLGVKTTDINKNSYKYIKKLTDNDFNVILKGQCTTVATKDRIRLLQARNPGLGTAGSGDVLSGIVGAYLATNSVFDAMILGVVTHSKAGLIAKEKYGEISLIASNIIDSIHEVLK